MKNVLFIFLFITNGLFSQNSDKAFTCDEVIFLQSQLASEFSSMTLSPDQLEDTYTSTRIPNGFEKAIYEKSIYSDATNDSYNDFPLANGKDSIQQKLTKIKASKSFKTESEAQLFFKSISETLDNCLKNKGFEKDTWNNETNEGNSFINQSEKDNKILYSEIQLSINKIIDGKTVMFSDNIVGYTVLFDWTFTETMFY